MAEVNDDSKVKQSQQPLPFLEVVCKSSGKIKRFSAGTEAGFAVNSINKKLLNGGGGSGNIPMVSHIEAVKEDGEEPVSFGPNSLLVNYGPGWKLQTIVESNGGYKGGGGYVQRTSVHKASAKGIDDSDSMRITSQSPITSLYLGKILLVFIILFVVGAIFTLALENLPRFILYVNSSV